MDKGCIGKIVITLSEDLALNLETTGIMSQAHFLSMASDYLHKYKDEAWRSVWEPQKVVDGDE